MNGHGEGRQPAGCHHYKLDVRLSPTSNLVAVSAAIDLCLSTLAHAIDGEILLALHGSARIGRFEGPPGTRFELREGSPVLYSPDSATLAIVTSGGEVSAEKAAAEVPVLHFEIEYELRPGIIQPWEVNRVTPEWVELGSYAPWFPLDPGYGSFTYEAVVRAEPGFVITGNGEVTRADAQGDGDTWHLRGNRPGTDCVLIASRALREETGRWTSVLYAGDEHAPHARRAVRDGDWLLGWFRELFGAPAGDGRSCGGSARSGSARRCGESTQSGSALSRSGSAQISRQSDNTQSSPVRLVIAPRTKGGGYARPGFVVLTPDGLEDPVRAFRWIAHELAHLWWCRADVRTWEDWLNESLAEYSALLAVRERFGDAAADGLLARKQADMPGLPPVRGLPRDHEQAHAVLYGKGCVLLHELAESVGTETFGRLLRQATETALSSTDEFLELLASLAGREAAGRFGRSLETL